MINKHDLNNFKPRARLLLQLGDQLIRNENIAVVELVKNAYDADATKCEIFFNNINSQEFGEIVIKDNGIGMTRQIVEKIWFEPGADFKELILDGDQYKLGLDITLPKRIPIGEKGVGRFGVHKLGNFVELVTKSADSKKEVVVEIDWDRFKNKQYLEEVSFKVIEREPQVFSKGKTGTALRIKKLKKVWDIKTYKDLQKTLLSLNSPFQKKSDFHIQSFLHLEDKEQKDEWCKQILTIEKIKEKALWRLDCTIMGDEITDFHFEFIPWPEMDKLTPRILTIEDLPTRKIKYKEDRLETVINLSKYRIGPVRIQAFLFDLGTKILKYGFSDPVFFKQFMASNGGVRVYRDDFRVYDYGETENDWLNLDKLRINEPVRKIGNRNILAAVQLNRKDSRDLIEKTNREGFIENDAYKDFQRALSSIIDTFAQQRNIDKLKIRNYYEGSTQTQPVLHDIDNLKQLIEEKVNESNISDKNKFTTEIYSSLDRIRDQYIETNKILLKSAGAGLSLSVVIHEIEKRVKELINVVDGDVLDSNRVKIIVFAIARLVDNYAVLVASEKTKNVSIKKIINDAVFNCEFRFKAHNVEIIKAFEEAVDSKVDCSVNIIIGVLLNIFDNSLYWLNTYEIKNRKILINLKKYNNNEVSVIIADNGKGFTISPEDAIQPFITTKIGGIGLGLHIVNEMMKANRGNLVIRDYKEMENLPSEFENGAILELIFKEKK